MSMSFIFGSAAVLATFLGGYFALRQQDQLHLILGFSAGAVMGVAFFDLLPESLELTTHTYQPQTVTVVLAIGFLVFMLLNRFFHSGHQEDDPADDVRTGHLGAGSLSMHSFLDGVGIGLAFQVSAAVGIVVAVAVLVHDFSDGINTVSFILTHKGDDVLAKRWLAADALAPLLGVLLTSFFSLSDNQLGLLLALFCGFFLYIGASELLPESQHRHPQLVTSLMTVAGVVVMYVAIYFAGV